MNVEEREVLSARGWWSLQSLLNVKQLPARDSEESFEFSEVITRFFAMDSGPEWTTIESDPGVFTELIDKMGVKGVQVEELYSLDRSLHQLKPIYGLIFLFKWVKEQDDRPIDYEAADSKGVFFASQVITNACATQALISILLNCPHIPYLGPELSQLKEFTTGFPSDMKGLAINNSDTIRSVHNSFTPPQPFVPEEKQQDSGSGDAFHFVAYVPAGNDGGVYELDGLKPGPIRIGECSPSGEDSSQEDDDAWLDVVSKVIEERIAKYAAAEVRFNLMAVVKSRVEVYSEQLHAAEQMCRRIEAKLTSSSSSAAAAAAAIEDQDTTNNYNNITNKNSIDELTSDRDALQSLLIQSQDEIDRLKMALQGEKEKRAHWEDENLRRRTDYTPVIFQSLKALAEAGLLQGLVDKAKEKQAVEEEEKKKNGGGGEK